MPSEWANPGIDVHLALEPRGGRRAAIEQALRGAIRAGRLPAGTRLPASRTLAADLGVARGTVADAYAQLVAEGFLEARQGAGTTVAATAEAVAPAPAVAPARRPRHDLRPGFADASGFPRQSWLAALRRALAAAPDAALHRSDARGLDALRNVLAGYLGRARGVLTSPERLLVCSGFTQGFDLVCRALCAGGATRLGLEDPCLEDYRLIADRAGLEVVPVPVDELGAQVPDRRLDAVLLTPAHQFPLGATLAAQRRAALVRWARAHAAWLIEDDYDGEFRYDRQPVGALQGLDPERVVYAGTAAKALAPGVRLGWLALPAALVAPVAEAKRLADRATSALEQLALAELMASGHYDRHLRRMRRRYARRRDAMLRIVAARPPGIAAGLHVVLEVADEDAVLTAAEERGVAVGALRPYWHEPRDRPGGIVVGYGAAPEHAFPAALAALDGVLTLTRRRAASAPRRGSGAS